MNLEVGLIEKKWNTIKTKPMGEELSEESTQLEN